MNNNSTCFFWNGTVSPDVYCGSPSLSTCCGPDWDCLSNGLCRQRGTTSYAQGSCTEQNFQNCLSFCNQGQFDEFTEVSRCDPNGNSWCCAGAAGQGLGGENCCDTKLTTSLEPYPFSAIDWSRESAVASTSVFSTTTPSTDSLSSGLTSTAEPTALSTSVFSTTTPSTDSLSLGLTSTAEPTALSTTAVTSVTSVIGLTGSLAPTVSQTSITVSTSLAQPPLARQNNDTTLRIAVGLLLAVIVVFLAVVAFLIYQKARKHKLGLFHLQHEMEADPLPEMDGGGAHLDAELDITHYELNQLDAPRHELG